MTSVLFTIFFLSTVNCQSLLHFQHFGNNLPNNSFVYSANISDGGGSLKCVTDSVNCCNGSDVGNWRDERGRPVQQGADGTSCLYVTRGYRVVSLNRKNSDCIPDTTGLWRCDTPDSSGEMQSLFIYISNDTENGLLDNTTKVNFTLHTEPRASPPEFTISCRTHGGPATTVQWAVDGVPVQEDSDHETSQIILDASHNSVYDNRLRVRGRTSGIYSCKITNNIRQYLAMVPAVAVSGVQMITVAGEPTSLTAVISESNSTHVNITVSWESPATNVTGYVIYYQSKGGPVISDMVSGGETETHSLDGLQRGVTYYISIVALSHHLPSPLVGPVAIGDPVILVVETSPDSLTTSPNNQFSVNCTARAEVDGHLLNMTIEWTRITVSPAPGAMNISETKVETILETREYSEDQAHIISISASGSGVGQSTSIGSGYQSILTTTENDTVNIIIYRCTARALYHSRSSDTTVTVQAVQNPTSSQTASTAVLILETSSPHITAPMTHFATTSTATALGSTVVSVTVTPTTKDMEVESPPRRDNTAVIAGAVVGGVCLIFASAVVFLLFLLFSLDCKRHVSVMSSTCSQHQTQSSTD